MTTNGNKDVADDLRVTGGPDEVETSMNSHVNFVLPLRLLFLLHIKLVLVFNKIDNGCPTLVIVDIVTETGSVDNSKFNLESLLFKFCFDNVYLNCAF